MHRFEQRLNAARYIVISMISLQQKNITEPPRPYRIPDFTHTRYVSGDTTLRKWRSISSPQNFINRLRLFQQILLSLSTLISPIILLCTTPDFSKPTVESGADIEPPYFDAMLSPLDHAFAIGFYKWRQTPQQPIPGDSPPRPHWSATSKAGSIAEGQSCHALSSASFHVATDVTIKFNTSMTNAGTSPLLSAHLDQYIIYFTLSLSLLSIKWFWRFQHYFTLCTHASLSIEILSSALHISHTSTTNTWRYCNTFYSS
jgi:hypothetical protein